MNVRKALALAAALTMGGAGLAGCSSSSNNDGQPLPTTQAPTGELSKVLASHGLADLEATEIVDTLDATPLAKRPTDLLASVRPSEIVLTSADGSETTMPLPKDKFYLSFAPYIDQTHDCYFHSLTTCTAELSNKDFDVTIVDSDTGEKLVDDTLTSFDNGFISVWLPKGIEAELSVQYEGKSASAGISTVADDDATCLTTLQLS